MSKKYIREACVEGLGQALAAQKQGADRIELCANLSEDGLTPEIDVIMAASEQLDIPIRVMIRPRAGDFVYSKEEIQEMIASIEICKSLRVEGVVFGVVKQDGQPDLELVRQLCDAAGDLKTVFHKAIEEAPDLPAAAQAVFQDTPVDAILTAGGEGKATDNLPVLRKLLDIADQKELVACGKITDENLTRIHEALGANSYHGKKIVGTLPDPETESS